MKNIGILTWFKSSNYGTCLQAYALSSFLRNNNYNAYLVENLKFYYGLKNPIESIVALVNKYKNKLLKHPNSSIKFEDLPNDIKEKYLKRIKKNEDFAYTKNNVKVNYNKLDYERMLEETDIFITGSDQIWNPNYVSPSNLLAFASNHKKIAYASSIGVEHIPNNKKHIYKKYLSRFSKIGVREKTAQSELSTILKKDVVTVLDPTFLLNKGEWSKIIDKTVSEPLPDKKYIFCYFIGKNREWEKQVKTFAEKNGYEVYCALSESYILPDVGVLKPELGVEDFVNYLLNADIVATDSFHAIALSINFNKNFVAFKRFKDTDNKSQNSRIIDILSTFKLSNQLIELNNSLEFSTKEIDYSKSNEILKELRKYSKNFLIESIEEE